jgi:hypothetical protein
VGKEMNKVENIINHIALVLDASDSMRHVKDNLIKVADNQIEYLATRSKELDQETRITVYTFEGGNYYSPINIKCLIYDKDVLRVPSISQVYELGGATPLIDATLKTLSELAETPERYGEHSFLVYVLTDGMENTSKSSPNDLLGAINKLPDNWTLATFVPDQNGVFEAKKFGFPKDNIAVWSTDSKGVEEVGKRIRESTENFMQARSRGVRSVKNLFQVENVSLNELKNNLQALHYGQFRLYDVGEKIRIDAFIERETGRAYKIGEGYYQLSKPEIIQPQKQIAILSKQGLYVGDAARQLLGLPDDHIKVAPNHNPDYTVFVQSTSNNRNLMPNTKLLILS